jgi:UDP-N-acetylmuramoyl-tripeptide--D-alanyl-D-alanine ligase
MAELKLKKIAGIAGGTILQGNPEAVFRGYAIDSRRAAPGDLFFALVAGRDGHAFVADAAARGAAGAVVSRPVAPPAPDFALVLVPDTVAALQSLARAVLAGQEIRVVGVTGSAGKTTTKEFTAALLSTRIPVFKSEGNFNNHLGLALSVLSIGPGHRAAVLEMGMSGPGEIRTLVGIAPPDIAVITNIHPVHLEFLKTMENIAAAKKEILDGAKPGATAVLNGDDPYVERIALGWPGRIIHFGRSRGCDVRAENIRRLGFDGFAFDLAVDGERAKIRLPFLFESHIDNFLAAVGVGRVFGLPLAAAESVAPKLVPADKRGVLLRLGCRIVVIDDSYNSNPRALEAALAGGAGLPAKRRIAVLGDMLELGEATAFFHAEAGRQAVRNGWDVLVTVGPLGVHTARAARDAGLASERIHSFASSDEAAGRLLDIVGTGDLVLVKGSRGIRTDRIVERLKETLKES